MTFVEKKRLSKREIQHEMCFVFCKILMIMCAFLTLASYKECSVLWLGRTHHTCELCDSLCEPYHASYHRPVHRRERIILLAEMQTRLGFT